MSLFSRRRPRTGRTASPDRLARAMRWLRWPVVGLWLIVIVLIHPLASTLSQVTNDSAAANLPSSATSTKVIQLQQGGTGPNQNRPQSDQVVVVFANRHGLTAADAIAIVRAHAAVGAMTGQTAGLGTPGQLLPSSDHQAAEFSANITAAENNLTEADSAAVTAIRRAVAGPARAAADGLTVAVTGSAAVTADSGSESQNALLLTAVVIVALILLIVYRSPVIWTLPLLSALAAIVVAQAAAHGLGSAGLTVSTLSTSILIVLVFGAACDYALLLTHRYREELQQHERTEDAMAAALRRTLPTLLASGGTVICAMLCLLSAQSAALHGLGPVGALGIMAALFAQITFLPALLLVLGRAAFWPRAPRAGQPDRGESRIWTGIGQRVARHPIRVTVAAVFLLGAACLGLAALHTDSNPIGQVKGQPGSVAGAQMITAHYPAGIYAPLVLLAPPSQAGAAQAAARATADVQQVASAAPVAGYDSFTVILASRPFGATAARAIGQLRSNLARTAPGALVGGQPAVQYDVAQAAARDTAVLVPLVLVVITVIIALLLRAIVAPVVLVVTTALSFAASFGLSTLLWRYGLHESGVEPQLPLYIFIFLVALGVDYNIFLSARIREESRRLGLRRGTLRGLGVTGGVITAAGIVLGATFAALAELPSVPVTQVGTAVAIGVLLDTLLVRTVLVPASLLSVGNRVWWPGRTDGEVARSRAVLNCRDSAIERPAVGVPPS